MGYFNRSGRDNRGGGRGFGAGRDNGRRNDGPREMFKTVCSSCGKDCEVPFKPTTGKPVYCSDCFERVGGRSSDSPRNDRPDRNDRPSYDRPRSNDSRRDDRPQTPRVDYAAQFEAINTKLDKLISLMTPKVEVEKVKEVKVVKTPKVKKVKVAKEV